MDPGREAEALETLDIAYELSCLLNCDVDKETLRILIQLCEQGVNPEALARVVRELRREAANIQALEGATASTISEAVRKPPGRS